ncbi:unnamed protein product [Boreogadus saida]
MESFCQSPPLMSTSTAVLGHSTAINTSPRVSRKQASTQGYIEKDGKKDPWVFSHHMAGNKVAGEVLDKTPDLLDCTVNTLWESTLVLIPAAELTGNTLSVGPFKVVIRRGIFGRSVIRGDRLRGMNPAWVNLLWLVFLY